MKKNLAILILASVTLVAIYAWQKERAEKEFWKKEMQERWKDDLEEERRI